MIQKDITYFGKSCTLACDANCGKAWGINNRPKIIDGKDEDDYAYIPDDKLGVAPEDPGTYEGFAMEAKPTNDQERLNRWCARECERSVIVYRGSAITLPDFSALIFNIPRTDKEVTNV